MQPASIDSIIADILKRLQNVKEGHDNPGTASVFRDIEIFAAADPVLADLHKAYLEAGRHYRKLAATFGADDPMVEVSLDMLDSARSGVQTRLIELQDLREVETRMIMARRLRARQAAHEAEVASMLVAARKNRKEGDIAFWLVMMYLMIAQAMHATHQRLSAANDFALVSPLSQKGRLQGAAA